MAIDRIIAGIILIPGVIHIAMLYATAGDPPFHAPAPALWVAIALGIIYTIESATVLRRRTQPVRMLWICIILELIRLTVLIVGGPQTSGSSPTCIAVLAYAAIRYTLTPYKQLAAQSVVYTIEVPRVLFLGICLDFYYCLRRVLVPKFGFHFDRGSVSQALVKPRLVPP